MARRFFERRIVDSDDLWALTPTCSFNAVCYHNFVEEQMLLTHFNLILIDDEERTLELDDIVWAPKRGNSEEIYRRIFLIKTKNITRCLQSSLKKNTILMQISNRMLSSLAKKRSKYGLLSRLFAMFKMRRPHMLHLEAETSLVEIKGIYNEDTLCSRRKKILIDPIERIYIENKRCSRRRGPGGGFIGLPNPPPALLI
jgi:hypothetical protein